MKNKKIIKLLTKEFLYQEYIKNNKSSLQIAKEIGCSDATIRNKMIKHNIPRRTLSEARKGKYLKEKGSNYKDGCTLIQHYCKEEGCNNEISYKTWKDRLGHCQSCAMKKVWQNPEFREKTIKAIFAGHSISPNNPETLLIKLLNNILPKVYTFVGDGKLIVGGFCPDFVNKDNNKIIEFYGDYWHNKPDWSKRDKRRIIAYKKAGYKTLIVWEKELENIDKVKENIIYFNKNKKETTICQV